MAEFKLVKSAGPNDSFLQLVTPTASPTESPAVPQPTEQSPCETSPDTEQKHFGNRQIQDPDTIRAINNIAEIFLTYQNECRKLDDSVEISNYTLQ